MNLVKAYKEQGKLRGEDMKKRLFLISVVVVFLFVCLTSCVTARSGKYTEKEVEIVFEDGRTKTFKARFYADQPNVPYYGLKAYTELVEYNVLTCSKTDDGKLVFTNSQGVEAVVDPEKETLTSQNWTAFHNPALPYEKAVSLKDTNTKLVRITDITSDEEAESLTLDFAKHGLRMYAQDDDVYISLTMASNLFADIATWHLMWNGERARYIRYSPDMSGTNGADLDSPMMENLISKGRRPSDVALETYAELCFAFDYLYGHPGRAVLDEEIAQKGLNHALLDMGEKGEELVRGLKSTDGYEYLISMVELFMYYLEDGSHTSSNDCSSLLRSFTLDERGKYLKSFEKLLTNYTQQIVIANEYAKYARTKLWGEDWYHEYGNTAIISIDTMEMEEDKWIEFYNGAGEIPQDCVGRAFLGLRRASENSGITNVIFDFSANTGGYVDALVFITFLATGYSDLDGFDRTTGRKITLHYDVDANLDGVFDERDKESVYSQFKYGVMISKSSFSCGNVFPFIMRSLGAVIIGEPSAGGSCQVLYASLPDGISFNLSTSQFVFLDPLSTNPEHNNMEAGCPVDYPISKSVVRQEMDGVEYDGFDYRPFFDIQLLNEIMNQ